MTTTISTGGREDQKTGLGDPGGLTFVDFASISLQNNFTWRDGDGALIPGSNCNAAGCPNTTIAETYYRVTLCAEYLCTDAPSGYNARGANQGIDTDRRKSDGVFAGAVYLAENNGLGPHNIEEGSLVHHWQSSSELVPWEPGSYIFEAFTALVDLTKRSGTWSVFSSADILALSKVVYTNFTVLPAVSRPIFDPPQDFYSSTLDVTMGTRSDGAHVFYTLQPPFVYDEDGVWCPHMGSWCSGLFSREKRSTFHAVPNQPPDFTFSRRGLFSQLLNVGGGLSLANYSAPLGGFPFVDDWDEDVVNHMTNYFNSTGQLNSDEAIARFLDLVASDGVLLNSPATGQRYTRENITLFPLYTMDKDERGPGSWLLFEPVSAARIEDFHVNVSTCYNKTIYTYELRDGVRMETAGGEPIPDGAPVPEGAQQVPYVYNITHTHYNVTCERIMRVPAANPCPWSRDCTLLGEVSFKLRAFAMRYNRLNSETTSGLYTFIDSGFPQWMNTRDSCGGWRQSTANPLLKYAVSELSVWDTLAVYDCPPGYHWASTQEGLDLLGFEGDEDVDWAANYSHDIWATGNSKRHESRFARHFGYAEDEWVLAYSDQCGWVENIWEGHARQHFRFSDSGPRYLQYMPAHAAGWPDELHFLAGPGGEAASSLPSSTEDYRSHITAWYWYEHNESFTLSLPYELPDLYDKPSNATWAVKAADSLDYLGLEVWSGDNLGRQPRFAGAVCRTNGDWTPPRVVVLGEKVVTLEVHTLYVEYGAQAWDPVDDMWYPEWKSYDGVDDDLDDGVVRISGSVNVHAPGVYYVYYDATDLHGNQARQQVRTIFILDRTRPVQTVTSGVHRRVCEPETDSTCAQAEVESSFDGLLTKQCPPRHTCDVQPGGFLNPRGLRTQGTEMTVEVGTQYTDLGASATDNLKDSRKLSKQIVAKATGPLRHIVTVFRSFPAYPDWYMINIAITEYRAVVAGNLQLADTKVTAKMVIDLGLVQNGTDYSRQKLRDCHAGTGVDQNRQPYRGVDIWRPEYAGWAPNYCGFEFTTTSVGVFGDAEPFGAECSEGPCESMVTYPQEEPFVFDVRQLDVQYEDGYEFPCTLSKDQPVIAFDYVNFRLPGVYNVTYDVSDDYNNTADTVSRTVTVKDTTPPLLHLIGEPIMFVRYGEEFVDPGATATDTGDDYYYNLNRVNITESCAFGECTNEPADKNIDNKIIKRVHHERLECEHVPIYPARNKSAPVCLQARAGQTADIRCPLEGTVIKGYNFLSFGQPEGECYNAYEPLTPSETCYFRVDDEIGETVPADVAMFNARCLGQPNCTLWGDYRFYTPQDTLLGADYVAEDPCPNKAQWLLVEAVCDWNSTVPKIADYVDCRDEFVQIPQIDASGHPPLLGKIEPRLVGKERVASSLTRLGGSWRNMDDFLSRVPPELARLDAKFVHQDVWGEEQTNYVEGATQNLTMVNTSVLGLYILTYDVSDMAGNQATQIARFVIVQDDSELYQNSIQQVYDGTPGTFTGGILPHETGGSIRAAKRSIAGLMDLAKNRPTDASSLWGVHTPSSAAVDGLYDNSYIEPFVTMDEYGRTVSVDHVPNIFMSGPAIASQAVGPQWWSVHLASLTDDPTVVVHMRDCCTEQFGKTLRVYIGVDNNATMFESDSPAARIARMGGAGADHQLCSTLENLEPSGVYQTSCSGSGTYIFIMGEPYLHFAEVEVFGFGGGHGQGRDSAADMFNGLRHDVGLHHDGAQFALTVPLANVSTSWWVEVPFISGRQMVLELNSTWPDEVRSLRAEVQHAVSGGLRDGHEVWNFTATGEQRRASDGAVYVPGPTEHSPGSWRRAPVEVGPGTVASVALETHPTGQARAVIGCGPRNDDLHTGKYFITVAAEPIVRTDTVFSHATSQGSGMAIRSPPDLARSYQAVPYSLRATFVEPILLPSAVDVSGTISHNVSTIFYFEVYLNQKIALELAGPEDAEHSVSAILSYGECTDRGDNAGYLDRGRLQTFKPSSDRPPGYDFLSLCPAVLAPGRYYLEMRSPAVAAEYSLRLSEYTPYCPNNCTGSPYMKWGKMLPAQGYCDCTILRCICAPGFYGDDCSGNPEVVQVDSYPARKWTIPLDRHGGGLPGSGTTFNLTCPFGHVVVGVTGSYYDYYNPGDFMGKLVRRVNLVCQPLLRNGVLGVRSNETVVVTNNHSLSIYSRTLSRFSVREEFLSPEQLDLDCITPAGKGHLDECRLLRGIWSAQQTVYTTDEATYAHTCGPNEVFVGQTVDAVNIEQTCADDGFGCVPPLKVCNYTIFNSTDSAFHNLTLPCHTLCMVTRSICVDGDGLQHPFATTEDECVTNWHSWTNTVPSACLDVDGNEVNFDSEPTCTGAVSLNEDGEEVELFHTWVPAIPHSCKASYPWGPKDALQRPIPQEIANITSEAQCTAMENRWSVKEVYVLCSSEPAVAAGVTSPWKLDESDLYWAGNGWDWRSQKFLGNYPNDYYATFRESSTHTAARVHLAEDLLRAGSDFHGDWHYRPLADEADHPFVDFCAKSHAVRLGATSEARCTAAAGCVYDAASDSCEHASVGSGRRRAQAWQAARRLQDAAATEEGGGGGLGTTDWTHKVSTGVAVLEPGPSHYAYVNEIGGICEKLSFAANRTAPGAAVLVRYEDDRHYPVDKIVGAGAQDTSRSQHGCSGDSCPAGDRTNPAHHKQRCPAGYVVTGAETTSGDWLDSIQFICAPLATMSAEEARLRELDIAAEEQAAMQEVLNKLAGLAALG